MTVNEAETLAGGASGERTGRNLGMAHAGAETDTAYGGQPKSEKDRLMSRVDIPKPQGGVRILGVPTVVDRLIQQALHQAMQPLFEPTFSGASYGFRPGRSARQAVRKAAEHIRAGKRWVVDMDLEKFFDRVNHDVLMARVARQVKDTKVLHLIRRFLQSGMMANGVQTARTQGTPQGGPLSPLLSNILLTDLDRELEKRKLSFCRYADDCNIYVRSQRAGQRIMDSVKRFLANRLKLTVNAAKSAVARPWVRKFLGYSVTAQHVSKIRIAAPSIERLKESVRTLCRRGRGKSLTDTIDALNPVMRGWMNYFHLCEGVEGASKNSMHGCVVDCAVWRGDSGNAPRHGNHVCARLG